MRTFFTRAARVLPFVAGVSVACGESKKEEAEDSIEVGTLVSLTGDLSGTGKDNTDAANLAIEEINTAGGVLGRKLRLVVEDERTTVEGARAGYARLLERRVPVVIGPSSSAQVASVIDLVAAGQTTTIARTATSPVLSRLADDGFLFRVAPSDIFQGKVLAALTRGDGVEHVCLVHRDDTYGTSLSEVFIGALGSGIDVVRTSYNPQDSDLSGVLDACDAIADLPNVGLVMMTFVADGAAVLAGSTRWSTRKQKFLFSDGARDVELLRAGLSSQLLEGARGTIPSGPNPETAEGQLLARFSEAFRARYGVPAPSFSANAYEAVYLAAAAIESSGAVTPGPAIRDALLATSTPGGTAVEAGDWPAIRAAIRRGEAIDYVGVTGRADFDADGDLAPPVYYRLWRIEGGESLVERILEVTE